MKDSQDIQDVVSDRRKGELWAMRLPSFWVERHGGCRSIGRAEHIGAEDEETTGVKGLAVPHERAPPEEAISACTMIGCLYKYVEH